MTPTQRANFLRFTTAGFRTALGAGDAPRPARPFRPTSVDMFNPSERARAQGRAMGLRPGARSWVPIRSLAGTPRAA